MPHEMPEIDAPFRDRFAKELFEWVDTVSMCIVSVVLVFTFVLRIVGVFGPSMEDTLHTGDKLIISHLNYEPKVGDIVVISMNRGNEAAESSEDNVPIIKRIVALENQKVEIDFETGEVYVDDRLLDEPYIKSPTLNDEGAFEYPVIVPEGCIFVLGDNRVRSKDSRDPSIGMVDRRYILGKAVFRIYPFSKFGGLY